LDATILVCTRNRAQALGPCLDAIAGAIAAVPQASVELVVVDNGSTDATPQVLRDWADRTSAPVRIIREERPGLSIARNTGVRAAAGRLIIFTDDDCRPAQDYLVDVFAHDRADGDQLVLRGGRVELGDPADLPFTILTGREARRFHKDTAPVRGEHLGGLILGANMVCRRAVFEKIGLFDERFGAGGPLRAGEDSDFMFRAYLAGIAIEYVPDMVIRHFHGRRESADIQRLIGAYDEAEGSIYLKFWRRDPALVRQFFWDVSNSLKEARGKAPQLEFGHTHRAKVASNLKGALRYLKMGGARPYEEPRLEASGRLGGQPLVEVGPDPLLKVG
jgi:glycosyltransferase involved in cell wall biosynthesis